MRKLAHTGQLLRQFIGFARESNNPWIVPRVIVFGLVALLVVTSEALTPYIYSLF